MDIIEAIDQRKSIRAFKPDPVPQKVLKDILERAIRAPSWANTQPWEFVVVAGEKLEKIRNALVEKMDEPPSPDLPGPQTFPESSDARRRELGKKIFEIKGIGREDREKRRLWRLQGLRLFQAPAVIYLLVERSFYCQGDKVNVWPILDCGVVAENIMLLAAGHRLGTIPQVQASNYPGVLRKILGIPDTKLIVLGIDIGYPDMDDPINQFRSEREPIDKITAWHGFDQKTG